MFNIRSYTYLKDMKWNKEIVDFLSSIHEFKGRHDVLLQSQNKTFERLKVTAFFDNVVYSSKLANFNLKDTRYKQLVIEGQKAKNVIEKNIIGYKKAEQFVLKNYQNMDITSETILKLYRILYFYKRNTSNQFKTTSNNVTIKNEENKDIVIFRTLSPEETPNAIFNITNEYNTVLKEYKIEPLLLIPIFLLDLLCISPFKDGNGRITTLMLNLLLFKSGYQIGKYVSLEKIIENSRDKYYESLNNASTNWYHGQNDEYAFIVYILNVILNAYKEFEDRLSIQTSDHLLSKDLVLQVILKLDADTFTKSEILYLCPQLKRSSVENALSSLVKKKKISKVSAGRSTYYCKIINK